MASWINVIFFSRLLILARELFSTRYSSFCTYDHKPDRWMASGMYTEKLMWPASEMADIYLSTSCMDTMKYDCESR